MKIMDRAKYGWHFFWFGYYRAMQDSCLEKSMKDRLEGKADYHRSRIALLSGHEPGS